MAIDGSCGPQPTAYVDSEGTDAEHGGGVDHEDGGDDEQQEADAGDLVVLVLNRVAWNDR